MLRPNSSVTMNLSDKLECFEPTRNIYSVYRMVLCTDRVKYIYIRKLLLILKGSEKFTINTYITNALEVYEWKTHEYGRRKLQTISQRDKQRKSEIDIWGLKSISGYNRIYIVQEWSETYTLMTKYNTYSKQNSCSNTIKIDKERIIFNYVGDTSNKISSAYEKVS